MTDFGWKYYPALKISLIFAGGIVAGHYFDPSLPLLCIIISLSLLWLLCAGFNYRLLAPFALLAVVLCSGALWYEVRSDDPAILLRNVEARHVEIVGLVTSEPVQKDGYVELRLRPDSLLWRNRSARLSGDLLVRVYDSTEAAISTGLLHYNVAIKGTFQIPSNPRIPGEFDYGRWLRSQGIVGMFYCFRAADIFVLRREKPAWVSQLACSIRREIRDFTERWIGGEEGDIALALLIGERRDIDKSTRKAFAMTGTTHVLAVSGLHVGIIALALFVLVTWIPGRWFRFLFFALPLAGYLYLTGAKPTILRAAIMALLFMLSYNTGRIARPLNTLGVAGLLLLLIDPYSLFDVGFQLSFCAVIGILLTYPRLWSFLKSRFPKSMGQVILGRVVQLLLLSIGAQVLTFPLSIHYFGLFSPLSALVNVAVVPLITIGLGAGVAGVLFPFAAKWFGGAAWLAINGTRTIVEWSAEFSIVSLDIQQIGSLAALILIIAGVWLVSAQKPLQIFVRSFSFLLLLSIVIGVDRRLDPLADSRSGFLYISPLSRSGGLVAALHHNDTLTLWYGGITPRDSSVVIHISGTLRQRTGASVVQTTDLLNHNSLDRSDDLIRINSVGPECGSSLVRLILSNTRRRYPGRVKIGREIFAQIPLQRKLLRTIVLDSRNDWQPVEWY